MLDAIDHESQSSNLASRPGCILLDYLRVRIPDDAKTWERLCSWVWPQEQRPFGWRGWYDRSSRILDGGLLAWCSNKPRAEIEGILVDLPGKACASMGEKLLPFLEWSLDVGHVTRADYALDDRAGLLTYDRVVGSCSRGDVVTRYKTLPIRADWLHSGWTQYFGSRAGSSMIRIYDKASEQGVGGHWVRCELEARGKWGDALTRAYSVEGSRAVIGQIARRLRFVEPGCDTNKRRWEPASWWSSFLGSVEPGAKLQVGEPVECTIPRLWQYIERQSGPAIATVLRASGGDLGGLLSMVDRSSWRMKPKHYAALEQSQNGRKHGNGPLVEFDS